MPAEEEEQVANVRVGVMTVNGKSYKPDDIVRLEKRIAGLTGEDPIIIYDDREYRHRDIDDLERRIEEFKLAVHDLHAKIAGYGCLDQQVKDLNEIIKNKHETIESLRAQVLRITEVANFKVTFVQQFVDQVIDRAFGAGLSDNNDTPWPP